MGLGNTYFRDFRNWYLFGPRRYKHRYLGGSAVTSKSQRASLLVGPSSTRLLLPEEQCQRLGGIDGGEASSYEVSNCIDIS